MKTRLDVSESTGNAIQGQHNWRRAQMFLPGYFLSLMFGLISATKFPSVLHVQGETNCEIKFDLYNHVRSICLVGALPVIGSMANYIYFTEKQAKERRHNWLEIYEQNHAQNEAQNRQQHDLLPMFLQHQAIAALHEPEQRNDDRLSLDQSITWNGSQSRYHARRFNGVSI